MLSLTEAEDLLAHAFTPLPTAPVAVDEALGQVLASNVQAELTQPRWPQVAMDGYAVLRGNAENPAWSLQEGCAAAGIPQQTIRDGFALRTTTGAPLPKGADTVVMQEDALVRGRTVTLTNTVSAGANVRPAGEDFSRSDVIIRSGNRISAGTIALLHHAGVITVQVHRRPRLAAVITGSELTFAAADVPDHQTPDSNGPFLAALAREHGYSFESVTCDESPETLAAALNTLRDQADALVVCGGASVGPRDGSHAGLQAVGAQLVFSKVAQKPGKPMAAYDWGGKPVLLLPGNPAAVFCCAYWHLLPLLSRLSGASTEPSAARTHTAYLDDMPPKVGGRSLLLRAQVRIDAGQVRAKLLGGQLSHLLSSAAGCNALVRLDPGMAYAPGSILTCCLLGPLNA